VSHTLVSTPQAAHHTWSAAGHHGGGHGFIYTLLRGFAWRTGSDVAHSLFRLAPTLIIGIVVVVLAVIGVRWLRSRTRS
jgi:high-affinity Fe2+/Pb2+ permease